MGMKPRKKPEPPTISGFDSIGVPLERWTVTRQLLPGHRVNEFQIGIVSANYQRITRGPSKGRQRMTLVVEYIDTSELGSD